jgi:hypothetical protein
MNTRRLLIYKKYHKKWRQKIRDFIDQVFNTNTVPMDKDVISMAGMPKTPLQRSEAVW